MSKFNYLVIDSCYWQQIADEQENRKRNFEPYDAELLAVVKALLKSYREVKP